MSIKKFLLLALLLSSPAHANELVFQFKNPSFSGVNTGAQWLTIENQETIRKKAIQDKIEADLKSKALEEKNSVLNRFINNLQSRIYSQLAQQLTNNLFGDMGGEEGEFSLEGNKITYQKTETEIKLTITDDAGNTTEIIIPTSGFKF
jgi:curli production assembly/transport component CsgF